MKKKYSCVCARVENKNIPVKDHLCFKNWNGSASAMKADIMVEGFGLSEEMHGIRYLKFIADRYASVYARLKEKVRYIRRIQKIECKNHLLKNVTKALFNLMKDSSLSKDGRKLLTQTKIKEIEKTVQHIIYENSLNQDVARLCDDFSNVVLHVLHIKCKEYYCRKVGQNEPKDVELLKRTAMYNHIMHAMDSLFKKSSRFIDNETKNRAEVFMQIVARFNSGKRLNLIQGGSFQRRATLASLRYNEGVGWHYKDKKKIVP
ncbi:hypothetical protein FQR65_LT14358 [Abscondita terminalis]|nr:hypothetical protein FQR65_LT14358 [Abscondita terminalis]